VVDAGEGRGVCREFLAKPLGETAPSSVPPWTGRRLNLHRFAGALGGVNPAPLQLEFAVSAPE